MYAAALLQNVFDTEEYQQSFKLLRFVVCINNSLDSQYQLDAAVSCMS